MTRGLTLDVFARLTKEDVQTLLDDGIASVREMDPDHSGLSPEDLGRVRHIWAGLSLSLGVTPANCAIILDLGMRIAYRQMEQRAKDKAIVDQAEAL